MIRNACIPGCFLLYFLMTVAAEIFAGDFKPNDNAFMTWDFRVENYAIWDRICARDFCDMNFQ